MKMSGKVSKRWIPVTMPKKEESSGFPNCRERNH